MIGWVTGLALLVWVGVRWNRRRIERWRLRQWDKEVRRDLTFDTYGECLRYMIYSPHPMSFEYDERTKKWIGKVHNG